LISIISMLISEAMMLISSGMETMVSLAKRIGCDR
jgi:hypothetical protein